MPLNHHEWRVFGCVRLSREVWERVIDPQTGNHGVLRPVPWRLAQLWRKYWATERSFGVGDTPISGTLHFQLALPCKAGTRWCNYELIAETDQGITSLRMRDELS